MPTSSARLATESWKTNSGGASLRHHERRPQQDDIPPGNILPDPRCGADLASLPPQQVRQSRGACDSSCDAEWYRLAVGESVAGKRKTGTGWRSPSRPTPIYGRCGLGHTGCDELISQVAGCSTSTVACTSTGFGYRTRHLGILNDPQTKVFLPVSNPIEQQPSFAFIVAHARRCLRPKGTKGAFEPFDLVPPGLTRL